MTKILSYIKVTDQHTTYTLFTEEGCTELCTLDGTTYVAVPDGVELPSQPEQIAASIQEVVVTPELNVAIKEASPHARLISKCIIDKIRERYTVDHELYLARIGVGAATGMYTPTPEEMTELSEFGVFVEGTRQWGRDERAKLGLS